ncbi:separin-like [Lingula anatina]|uniref:separase n=1 Tax=Lingula anatina TaxID=7574 RepID=A0A2R2MPS5_LINAN|nr:separin-like [Lingula anatina]|eukprot:XP_023932178.1 separin-like [Lingula anatina]
MCYTSVEKTRKCSITGQEHYFLGFHAYKFAGHFFMNAEYPHAVDFYQFACEHFAAWSKSDSDSQKVSEFQLYRRFEYLAESLRRCGRYKEAMEAVVQGILLDQGPYNHRSAAEIWVKIKRDISKAETSEQLKPGSLLDAIEENGGNLQEGDKVDFLESELRAHRNIKTLKLEDQTEIIQKLIDTSSSPVVQAEALIDSAVLLLAKEDWKSPVENCKKAIALLEKELQRNGKKYTLSILKDVLARAFFWLYVCEAESITTESQSNLGAPDEAVERAGSPTPEEENCVLNGPVFTLHMENQAIANLDKALDLWSAILPDGCRADCVRDCVVTSEGLLQVAQLYKMAGKPVQALRALSAASHLGDHISFALRVSLHTLQIQLLCSLNQPQSAKVLMDQVDGWLEKWKPDRSSEEYVVWKYRVAVAEVMVLSQKFSEAQEIFEMVQQQSLVSARTRDWCIVEGTMKRCLAKMLTLPPYHAAVGECGDYALDRMHEACSLLTGVWKFLQGKASESASLMDKWSIMTEYLDTLQATGHMYLDIGESRAAKCYLKEGMILAQEFNMPRRLSGFLLSLAKLDTLSEKFTDAEAKLNMVHFILNSEVHTVKPEKQPTRKMDVENEKAEKQQKKKDDCFGFDISDEEDDDSEKGLDFLKRKVLEDPIPSDENDSGNEDPCASPSLRKHESKLPVYLSHSNKCSCVLCHDFILHPLSMEYIHGLACLSMEMFAVSECATLVKTGLQFYNTAFQKSTQTLMSKSCDNLYKGKKEIDKLVESLFLPWSVRFYIQVADTKIETNLQWGPAGRALARAASHLNCSTATGLVNLWKERAFVFYLQALVGLKGMAEPSDYNNIVSNLNDEFQKVEITSKEDSTLNNITDMLNRMDVKDEGNLPSLDDTNLVSKNEKTKMKPKVDSGKASTENVPIEVSTDKITNPSARRKGRKTSAETSDSTQETSTNNRRRRKTDENGDIVLFKSPPQKTKREKTGTQNEEATDFASNLMTPLPLKTPKASSRAVKKEEIFTPMAMKTPKSVSSRRAALDMLMADSDSEEDKIKSTKNKRTGTRKTTSTTGRGKGKKAAVSNRKVETETSVVLPSGKDTRLLNELDAKSVVNGLKVIDMNSPRPSISSVKNGKYLASNPLLQSPVTGDVYSFDSPVANVVPATSLACKAPARKGKIKGAALTAEEKGMEDIEVCPAVAERPKRRGRPVRMTRSKVDFIEHQRENISESDEDVAIPCGDAIVEEEVAVDVDNLVHDTLDSPGLVHKTEEAFSLDASIEVLRAGDTPQEKRTTRGRGRRAKSGKLTNSAEDVEAPRTIKEDGKKNVKPAKTVKVQVFKDELSEGEDDFEANFTDPEECIDLLNKAYNLIRQFPPMLLYRKVCHMLGLLLVERDPTAAAFYMSEAVAVTFRHSLLASCNKKIKKLAKEPAAYNNPVQYQEELQKMQNNFSFQQSPESIQAFCHSLPKEWTVCQLSGFICEGGNSKLVITRYRSQQEPFIVKVPGFMFAYGEMHKEFATIMTACKESMNLTEKVAWWTTRRELDERLKDMMSYIENKCLREWRGVLLGRHCNDDDTENLSKAASAVLKTIKISKVSKPQLKQAIEVLIDSSHLLSDGDIKEALSTVLENGDAEHVTSLIRRHAKQLNLCIGKRQPIILILDKMLQHFPFESLPMLRSHPVTRLPSLHLLGAFLSSIESNKESVLNEGIDPEKTYYILNPGNDLPHTQKHFEDWFEGEKTWRGVVGKTPTSDQYKEALTKPDLFIYCGHGTGSKYLHGDNIQNLQCRPAVLLMGCSSGRLNNIGALDPAGMILSYFMAGCPCIVANLWDVTDRDIDRFLENLLKAWLPGESDPMLLEHIEQARDSCRLPHIIGAAPVVYGLPVALTMK